MAGRVRPVETESVTRTPSPEGHTVLVSPYTEGRTTVPDALVEVLVKSGYVKA